MKSANEYCWTDVTKVSSEYRVWSSWWSGVNIQRLPILLSLRFRTPLLILLMTQSTFLRELWSKLNATDDSVPSYYGTTDKSMAHFPFNFKMLLVQPSMNASKIKGLITRWYEIIPDGNWATIQYPRWTIMIINVFPVAGPMAALMRPIWSTCSRTRHTYNL